MKKILFVLVIGIVFLGCENDNSEIEELKKMNEELMSEVKELKDVKESKNIREEIIERWKSGEKKIVVTYKGEGSSEEIIYKVYYSTDGIICCDFEYENGKNVLIKHST